MKKLDAVCVGCLAGIISLVLIVAAVSYISHLLYDARFHYKERQHVASPNDRKYAHSFTNTNSRDSRAPYIGVSLSRDKRLNRNYEAEVFSISPPNAIATLDLEWIDNETLELKLSVNPSVKARISYEQTPPSHLARQIIFSEHRDAPEHSIAKANTEPGP